MATFTWAPSYGSALTIKPNVTPIKFGDGYENRVALGLNTKLRSRRLESTNRPTALADAIEAFLNARGALESFDWTPLYGAPGKWVCREWTASPTSPNHRTISCVFEEEFEP